jgi:glycyl-tRNA synthetase (class II)
MEAEIIITDKGTFCHVNYQIISDGNMIEIEGHLRPYHDGRCECFEFEPNWFADDTAEQYYDENWETIEAEILAKI